MFQTEKKYLMDKSARVLENNGLIIFPTRGLYGIGARIDSDSAVKRVYELKKRDYSKPLLILIKDISEVEKYCTNISRKAFRLMEEFWPGDMTIIFDASEKINPVLTGFSGKIGVRVPIHEFTSSLLKEIDFPITGTSANISGFLPPSDINEISEEIIKGCDFVIDSGRLETSTPSTVLDATSKEIKIIREGRVKKEEIFKL